MTKNIEENPDNFIVPLNMNGLHGRMMHLPAPKGKSREILFVYGHHSSLERWWGLAQDLNRYGSVTMPDLPGFGGMQSFYKIGEQATIDNLADYLAAFVKLRYKRKKFVLVGLSFGFVVATRMLQRYPDLVPKVSLLISVVGFAHHDDFTFSPIRHRMYQLGSSVFSHHLPAIFFRRVCLHPVVLRVAYSRTHNARQKFQKITGDERRKLMDFEIHLWHANDIRTYMKTTSEFLKLDNCRQRIDLPVWHIGVRADRYFNNHVVEQHLSVIYKEFHGVMSDMDTHAPSVIADAKTAAPLIPKKIRNLLSRA